MSIFLRCIKDTASNYLFLDFYSVIAPPQRSTLLQGLNILIILCLPKIALNVVIVLIASVNKDAS